MSLSSSMGISASGMSAQRLRMDVISDNIANVNTTRGADGGPYRRKFVVFTERNPSVSAQRGRSEPRTLKSRGYVVAGRGVVVQGIVEDSGEPRMVYDPEHPDADENGYLAMPNVDIVREMVDMISASRAYEANVTAVNAGKYMLMRALDIGR